MDNDDTVRLPNPDPFENLRERYEKGTADEREQILATVRHALRAGGCTDKEMLEQRMTVTRMRFEGTMNSETLGKAIDASSRTARRLIEQTRLALQKLYRVSGPSESWNAETMEEDF